MSPQALRSQTFPSLLLRGRLGLLTTLATLLAGTICLRAEEATEDQPRNLSKALEQEVATESQPLTLPSGDEVMRVHDLLDRLDEQISIGSAKLQESSLERKRQIGRRQATLAGLDEDLQQTAQRAARTQQRQQDFAKHAEILDPDKARELLQRFEAPIAQLEQQLKRLTTERTRLQQELAGEQKLHTFSLLQAAIEAESSPLDSFLKINAEEPQD